MKFPIGGYSPRAESLFIKNNDNAGISEILIPTVKVWMEEEKTNRNTTLDFHQVFFCMLF